MIHGKRGAVIGAVTTVGVIVGAEIPMFLGAMIVGPLAAWVLKQFDKLIEGKIKSGFKCWSITSLGIIGGALTLVAYTPESGRLYKGLPKRCQPVLTYWSMRTSRRWSTLSLSLQKYCSLTMRSTTGSSVRSLQRSRHGSVNRFCICWNQSGSGTGHSSRLLVLRTRIAASSPQLFIHFLGGIHEIYFPYILMKPVLILHRGWRCRNLQFLEPVWWAQRRRASLLTSPCGRGSAKSSAPGQLSFTSWYS